jgi:hypothetical protein
MVVLKDVTPTPLFFVSVASKGRSLPANSLQSTLMSTLVSVASKGLDGGRLRLKTGKTRCLSGSADSKRLKEILSDRVGICDRLHSGRVGIGLRKKSRGRRVTMAANMKKE